MGVMRVFGLIFFMTILIGGCIVAVSDVPPPPPVTYTPRAVKWDEAVDLIHQGVVVSVTQGRNRQVILYMEDGSRYFSTAPVENAIYVEIERCGAACQGIIPENL